MFSFPTVILCLGFASANLLTDKNTQLANQSPSSFVQGMFVTKFHDNYPGMMMFGWCLWIAMFFLLRIRNTWNAENVQNRTIIILCVSGLYFVFVGYLLHKIHGGLSPLLVVVAPIAMTLMSHFDWTDFLVGGPKRLGFWEDVVKQAEKPNADVESDIAQTACQAQAPIEAASEAGDEFTANTAAGEVQCVLVKPWSCDFAIISTWLVSMCSLTWGWLGFSIPFIIVLVPVVWVVVVSITGYDDPENSTQ